MQLIKLVNAEGLIESLADEKVDVSLSYKLMKFIQAAANEVVFYKKKRDEIIKQYALKDEKGEILVDETNGGIKFSPENKENIEKAFRELAETDVAVPDIKFHVQELRGLQLSIKDLISLQDFIIEEE